MRLSALLSTKSSGNHNPGSNLVEHAHFHALPYCHLHLDTSVESDCDHTARTYGSI